jgi:WD40 repeat protein
MQAAFPYAVDRRGRWFAFARGNDFFVRSLDNWSRTPQRIGRNDEPIRHIRFAGVHLAAELESGELWIWPIEESGDGVGPFPIREPGCWFVDESGDWLGVYRSQDDFSVAVWDFRGHRLSAAPHKRFPASVSAVRASAFFNGASFSPGGRWVATGHVAAAAFWPLSDEGPRVLVEDVPSGTGLGLEDLEFTPDGRTLVAVVHVGSFAEEEQVWAWDLETGGPRRILASVAWINNPQIAIDPQGKVVAVSTGDAVVLVPLDGGPKRRLEGFTPGTWIGDIAFDHEGRRVAACGRVGSANDKVIRIWDLETGEVTVLGPVEGVGDGFESNISGVEFLADGSVIASHGDGLRLWRVGENIHEVLAASPGGRMAVFDDGRKVARVVFADDFKSTRMQIVDLETKASNDLFVSTAIRGCMAASSTGDTLVAGVMGTDAAIQVGAISSWEPYILLGHQRGVRQVAVSPDGRWIASDGEEGSVRLWPMPDLSKPPPHTLPREELLAKLHSFTNVRAVRDEESATGWKLEVGPFPGWETVPEW